jgi:two-component system heavy metal sensor histidine kinase CusS
MPSPLLDRIPWATLRVRLTLLNTAVVLLATIAALLAVRIAGRAALYREADSVLRGEVLEISLALQDLHPNRQAVVEELRRKAAGQKERGWFAQLLDGSGTTIWKSENCPDVVAMWPLRFEKTENLVQAGPYRFVRRTVQDPVDEPFHIRIGMPTAFLEQNIDSLTRLLLPVGIVVSLLTPVAGYWLALRATSPISEILRTAEQLSPTRLGDRLGVRGRKDELDQLSLTINRLLDQVADHVARQQQFVADAAHELRGPLAALQSALEVTASKDRTADEYRATLEDLLEETRQLAKLANNLLLLAEGQLAPGSGRSEVDLHAIVQQTVGMFAGVAEERGIDLRVESAGAMLVAGEPRQLRQVVSNLLDNAIRFTPPGGHVVLRLSATPGRHEVRLTVADTGCGIEAQHLPRVFDRFFQADTARDRGDPRRGGGLGLAICRTLVERHGGHISVTSEFGRGTQFAVSLPQPAQTAGLGVHAGLRTP